MAPAGRRNSECLNAFIVLHAPKYVAMAIPDYQTLMLPLLRVSGAPGEHKFRDVVEALALQLQLTSE